MTDQKNPWTTLSTKRFYECPYLSTDEDLVLHRSGKIHAYTALRFRIHGVAVLPILADGSTVLVGQYRYLSQQFTWELPRGSGPLDSSPLDTAHRELEEEAGLAKGNWLEVFRLLVSPGITDEWAPCFVAWNLDDVTAERPIEEELTLRRLPFRDLVEAASSGSILDAASVATILAVQYRAVAGLLPTDLQTILNNQF